MKFIYEWLRLEETIESIIKLPNTPPEGASDTDHYATIVSAIGNDHNDNGAGTDSQVGIKFFFLN